MNPQRAPKTLFVVRSRLARLLSVTAAGAALMATAACGDASNNTGSTWHTGTPSTNTPGTPGTAATPATTPGGNSETPGGGGATDGADSGASRVTADGPDAAPPADPGTYTVSVGQTAMTGDLLADTVTPVTITPSGGFTGTVTLAFVPGTLPAGATLTGKFDNASVNVTGASPISANLTVRSNAATSIPFTVTATGGTAAPITTSLTFTANKVLEIDIPADASMNKTQSSFGVAGDATVTGPITVISADKITVNVKNLDAAGHIIHGPGTDGFAHGDTNNPIPTGSLDPTVRTVSPGTVNFYLHDLGQNNSPAGKLTISAPSQ